MKKLICDVCDTEIKRGDVGPWAWTQGPIHLDGKKDTWFYVTMKVRGFSNYGQVVHSGSEGNVDVCLQCMNKVLKTAQNSGWSFRADRGDRSSSDQKE